MLKIKSLFWIGLICVSYSFADSNNKNDKKEGYGYTVKKYFSGGKPISHRDMILYLGPSIASIYNKEKSVKWHKPFSSLVVGFHQQIWRMENTGDFGLKTEVQFFKLKKDRAIQINVNPVFSLPDTENGFPVYVGLGAGMGFYPYFIIKGESSLSVNAQVFAGLRLANLYENLGLNCELTLNMHYPFRDKQLYMETLANFGLLFRF